MAKRETGKPAASAGAGGADWVARLVKDPADIPEVKVLYGYLGASSEKDHKRLYLNAELTDYYEIRLTDILTEETNSSDPLGASYVWVKKDADLTHKAAGAPGVKAKFFSGEIAQEYLAGGAGERLGPTGVLHCTEAPPMCGNTVWKDCPVGPTGIQHCTIAPKYCGDTKWKGCPPGQTGVEGCTQSPKQCGDTQWPGCPVGQTGIRYCTWAPEFCGNTQWPGCPVGPTGVLHCTKAPQFCGNTEWKGCPEPPGPTAIEGCTKAPQYCGNTEWKGCPKP